ncbi:hypothetical protein CMO86_10175 [Candidatus Woesearchaeota archaeon]|nr:hypothetical protein [Candidatus Woesearchaeota archaeon]
MFSFKGFQTKAKNKHLEHLEDQIIDEGSKGGQNAVNFLVAIRNMLAGKSSRKVNMTVKWDGAPAIICGINPENGRFFVGTKSVFNKVPKINYTSADIRRNHSGVVAEKLSACLTYLRRIVTNGVYQGDLLFTSGDKSIQTIDGEPMITFTPNTITYAMPTNSSIGKKISNAKLGIVFHTKYSGTKIEDMRAGFGTVTGGGGRNVYLASAGYKDTSGSSKFTSSELTSFDSLIRMAQGSLSKAGPMLDKMNSTDSTSVGYRLKTFFNSVIRNSTGGMGKVKTLQGQFRDYYENFINAEIAARKTVAGKQKFIQAKKDNLKFIDKNQSALYMAIASHVSLARAKNFLVSKLSQIQSIGHFLKTSNGYKVTAPEGFVAVDRGAGAVKLVDRLEFSRANFTMDKNWG